MVVIGLEHWLIIEFDHSYSTVGSGEALDYSHDKNSASIRLLLWFGILIGNWLPITKSNQNRFLDSIRG